MKGNKYLSELIDISKLLVEALNIIEAPTGSGKSYFALTTIPQMVENATHKVVYLIDTINGRDQILSNYNTRSYSYTWARDVEEGGIWFSPSDDVVVMTYAKFGSLVSRNLDFQDNFQYIICDELHNLIKFQHFSSSSNLHTIAKSALDMAIKNTHTTVIALTATPNKVIDCFHSFNVMEINQEELIHYETLHTEPFSNIDTLLDKLDKSSIGICYTSHIHKMLELENSAKSKGFNPISIWSTSNEKYPLSEEQLEARDIILNEFRIPEKYNLLIINSACETSIKIKSKVDFAIIANSNRDTQIQVRGRINSDLEYLFLPSSSEPLIEVPEFYLGRPLYRADKTELARDLDIRDRNNRPKQWNSLKGFIIDSGYIVREKRINNCRVSVIEASAKIVDTY